MILLSCLLHDSSLIPRHMAGVHCTVSKRIDLERKDVGAIYRRSFLLCRGLGELVKAAVSGGVQYPGPLLWLEFCTSGT